MQVSAREPRLATRNQIWVRAERFAEIYESQSQGGFSRNQTRSVLINLLLEAQSLVWNTGGGAWPPIDSEPARSEDLPQAWAAVTPTEIRLWYGDAEQPALALEPISLSEL